MRGSTAVLVAVLLLGAARVGLAVMGTNDYVEYVPGGLPIIVTVPHGGSLSPDSDIPDRQNGCNSPCEYIGCAEPDAACPISVLKDMNTAEFALALSDSLFGATGMRPHVVYNHLHRSKLDANREMGEAAQGNAHAELAYTEYFGFISDAIASVQASCGVGIVIDVHGHAHPEGYVELGYALSASDLAMTDAEIDALDVTSSTFQSLLSRPRTVAGARLSQILTGPNSVGAMLQSLNIEAVPSNTRRHPNGAAYFTGGYTVRRYGRADDGENMGIDALQVELPSALRNTDASTLSAGADALVAALTRVIKRFYAIDPATLDGCPETAPVCDLGGPAGAFFFQGYVWDDTCSVVLHGACPPDDASAMMVYDNPDTGAAQTLYRRLATKQTNMQREDPRCSEEIP